MAVFVYTNALLANLLAVQALPCGYTQGLLDTIKIILKIGSGIGGILTKVLSFLPAQPTDYSVASLCSGVGIRRHAGLIK